MPESPSPSGPPVAYVEDCEEESQDTVPGTKQSANIAAKRRPEVRTTQRDAASTPASSNKAANGSASSDDPKKQTSTKNGFMRTMARKMTGKKSQAKEAPPPSPSKPGPQRNLSRSHKADNLRLESQEDAARMRVSGAPVTATKSAPTPHTRPHNALPSAQAVYAPISAPPHAIPIQRPLPSRSLSTNTAHIRARPLTYHDGMLPGYSLPMHFYDGRPQQPPQLHVNTAFAPQHQSFPAAATTYIQTPASANRQSMYPFPPTTFDHHRYAAPQADPWLAGYRPPPPPPPPSDTLRRPSWSSTLVEYPQIPSGYHRSPPYSAIEPLPRRLSIHHSEPGPVYIAEEDESEEALFMDDESYYRELDRRRMPPPPVPAPRRPQIRHSATTHSTQTHRTQPPSPQHTRSSSPRRLSFERARPVSRPSLSSSRHGSGDRPRDASVVEDDQPPSPVARRRLQQRLIQARPQSFHGGRTELERQVEAYQAERNGTARPPVPVAPEAPHAATLPGSSKRTSTHAKSGSKHHAKTGSETGSRGSSSRDGSDSKKRTSVDRPLRSGSGGGPDDANKGFSVTMTSTALSEGRTIKVRPSREKDGGVEFSIGGGGSAAGGSGGGPMSVRASTRDGRPRERSDSMRTERRYSTAGRDAAPTAAAGLLTRKDTREGREDRAVPPTDAASSTSSSARHRERSVRRERSDRREPSSRREPSTRRRSRSRPAVVLSDVHPGGAAGPGDGEAEMTDRLRRLRAESRSRRSSRSAVSARTNPAAEGAAH